MQTSKTLEENNFIIQRGLWDSKKRRLTICTEFIQFDDELSPAKPYSRFETDEITEFRYGINWIRGFEFTIGREYQIFLRNKSNKVFKINFKSFYGVRKNELHKLYCDIFDALWASCFSKISRNLITKFHNGEVVEFENLILAKDGISFKKYKNEKKIIPWEKVGTRNYQTYFSIYSNENPANINCTLSYLKDWNTGVIYSVLQSILEEKNFFQE